MKTKLLILALCGVAFFCTYISANAQQVTTHKPWTKEDSAAINALVMYPDSIRMQIFEACEYPAAIVNIASLQKNTSTAFADLVSGYSKEKQEDIWNLSRYPGLIQALVGDGRKSREQLDGIVAQYPSDIREIAVKYGREDYELLKKVNDVQAQSESQFEQTISDLPPYAQSDFRQLIQLPEVLTLLNDHLSLAVRVGDQYKRDPLRVMRRTDSLNLAEARQNAQNLEDWKNDVSSNPDAQNDLKNAASQYAQDNGYTQQEAAAPVNPEIINSYVAYPYPYWFGYPTWYTSPYWYPHPYWFDCGFYYDPYGNMRFFGTPSFYFTNWFFYHPEYCARYPHLGGVYVNHYYDHRRYVNGNYLVVHNWVQDNRNYLPKDFTSNRQIRDGAIREVGQMNTDYMKENRGTNSPEARDAYFRQNVSKYPTLKQQAAQPRMPEERSIQDVREQPVQQSRSTSRASTPEAPARAPSQRTYNNVNQGQNYHRSGWEQAQPTQRAQPVYRAPEPSRQAPAPRSSPSPAPRSNGGGGRR